MAILNCISTHTLTWSVTVTLGFQHITISISTHTLTWSVTKLVSDIDVESLNFNSHAHVERDFSSASSVPFISNFNSHAHVERDNLLLFLPNSYHYFNSHAHVERDLALASW